MGAAACATAVASVGIAKGAAVDTRKEVAHDAAHQAKPAIQEESAEQKTLENHCQREAGRHEATAEVSSMPSNSKVAVALVPVNTKLYQGVVSWFRGSYGWLS